MDTVNCFSHLLCPFHCLLLSSVHLNTSHSLGSMHDAPKCLPSAIFDLFSLYWSTPDFLFLRNPAFESHLVLLWFLFTNHLFHLNFHLNFVNFQNVGLLSTSCILPDSEGTFLSWLCLALHILFLLGICSWDVIPLSSLYFSI